MEGVTIGDTESADQEDSRFRRLVEVDERISRLTALRGELSAMLESHHHGTVGECRIVEVLSDHECCTSEH